MLIDPLYLPMGDARASAVSGGPRSLVGRFALDTLSELPTSDIHGRAGLRSIIMAGCFADSIARAGRGEQSIRLLLAHDPRYPLAATGDGTLSVWEADGFLCWRAMVPAAAVPASVRGCSLTPLTTEFAYHRMPTGEDVKVITRASLVEISITDNPAMGRANAPAWLE